MTEAGFDLSTSFSTRHGSGSTHPSARPLDVCFVVVSGVRLRLSVTGHGPPLLFLFGSGAAANIENAHPIMDRFGHSFTVACHDQRGLGMSDVPPAPWTMADYAADAFGVADHLGWDRFSVVGLSFGGMVALEMAATDPRRLERLVLWGTSPGGYAPSYPLHELEDLPVHERFRVFPQILDIRLRNRPRSPEPPDSPDEPLAESPAEPDHARRKEGLALQLQARRGHDVLGRLSRFDSPTLIGAGAFDGLAPLKNAEILHAEIPNSELHVYQSGHLFYSESGAFDDALRFLLAGQGRPGDHDHRLPTATVPAADWQSLPDQFADQAELSPEAIAIRFDGESLSYAELARRSNQLARLLIERGVGPDSIVPILIDRSPLAIVAILGVLAAGGAYLPMDPEAPLPRIQVMAADSGAALLLTATEHAATAAVLGCDEILVLDDPGLLADLAHRSAGRVKDRDRRAALGAHQVAFVVYSSGSTGSPKGSLNTHAGVANFVQWHRHEFGLGSHDRALHQTTLIFDMAVAEIFLPLVSGGVVVIARPGGQTNPSYIAELVRTEAVSWAFFVPTLLVNFLEGSPVGACASLRHVLCAGEPLTGRIQALCHSRLPDATLWNSYGPSEAALGVTLWRCRRGDGDTAPPIGFPGPGVDLHILDSELEPVAADTAGELFVSGVPLSRGYLARPELTSESFLPSPFGPPAALMYRTGDVVARRHDGALEFRGRRDTQIKINGVRIEPGEIEVAIAALPGIARVAVIARHLDGGQRLIAYIIADAGSPPPDPAALSVALSERLPWSMVPGYFVVLDAFPRTASGKLAVRELPDPDVRTDRRVDPCTDAQRQVHSLWTDVLGHERFGIADNFFMVGGNSLAAAQLQARFEDRLGRPVPLPRITRFVTIQEQADWLTGQTPAAEDCLVTLQPDGQRAPLFAVHGWGGRVFQYVDLARALAPDRPVLGLQFIGADPAHASVADLAAQYADRILRHRPQGPINLIGVSAGGWYAYAVAAALLERGATLGTFVVLDSHAAGADIHPRLRLALLIPKIKDKLHRLRGAPAPQAWSSVGRLPRDREPADPFHMLSRKGFRPPRLPVTAYLFGTPQGMTRLRRTWRFYALDGVHCEPMFNEHIDFWGRPELAPELAAAVERVLADHEASSQP